MYASGERSGTSGRGFSGGRSSALYKAVLPTLRRGGFADSCPAVEQPRARRSPAEIQELRLHSIHFSILSSRIVRRALGARQAS